MRYVYFALIVFAKVWKVIKYTFLSHFWNNLWDFAVSTHVIEFLFISLENGAFFAIHCYLKKLVDSATYENTPTKISVLRLVLASLFLLL